LKDRKNVVTVLDGVRIKRAERPKIGAVSTGQRDGNIALDTVQRESRVLAEARIAACVIDFEGCDRTRDDVSIGVAQRQVITGLDPKPCLISHRARCP
jgi:hypothetical protein